jgi:hypothetical protein
MIHPRDFITEYVDPAIALWRQNQHVKHLAVHAITEVDVLAAIVALWTRLAGRRTLPQREESEFRNKLGAREPALALIRDAHDSHKHGALGAPDGNGGLAGTAARTHSQIRLFP